MKTFLYSDPHFSHFGVCRFLRNDGSKLRPYEHPDEMDDDLVMRYNSVVAPNDKVYFLGDVAINRRGLQVLYRLNGRKILIKGNHDIFKLKDYSEFFDDIRAYHVLDGMIMSHIPVHPNNLGRFSVNIHGHTHANQVMKITGFNKKTGELIYSDTEYDHRYYCVCVEHTDYTPIDFETVKKTIIARGGTVGFRKREE